MDKYFILGLFILITCNTLYKLSSGNYQSYWRIIYMDQGAKKFIDEAPISTVKIIVKDIDYNQESYDPATKTLILSPARFY